MKRYLKIHGLSLKGDNLIPLHAECIEEAIQKSSEQGIRCLIDSKGQYKISNQSLNDCIQLLTPSHNTCTFILLSEEEYEESGILNLNERIDIYCSGINESEKIEIDSKKTSSKRDIVEFVKSIDNGNYICNRPNGNIKVERRWANQFLSLLEEENENFRFLWDPADYSWSLDQPTFVKARAVDNPKKSIIVPLHKYFPWDWKPILRAESPFDYKIPKAVWRGTNSSPFYEKRNEIKKAEIYRLKSSRRDLLEHHYNNNFHDIGLSEVVYKPPQRINEDIAQQFIKNRLSIDDHLKFKYILCPEGNDYPSNLPWVLLSNSVPVMPPPFVETWLLESKLKAWIHYVPLAYDFSDLDTKINWCNCNIDKVRKIAMNSRLYALQFFDQGLEYKLAKAVVRRYRKNTSFNV